MSDTDSNLSSIIGEPAETPQEPAAAAETPAAAAPEAPAQAEQQKDTSAPAAEQAPKMIPYQALLEERRMRQQERAQREEIERRVESRLAALQQQLQPAPPPPPNPDENPIGYLAHQQGALSQQVAQLAQHSQQAQQAAAMAQAEAHLASLVNHAEAAFNASNPDYQQAIAHVHTLRVKELQLLGHDEIAAQDISARELKQAAYFHAANGRNPAEVMYGIAKVRGFASKPAAPAPATPAEQMQLAQRGAQAASSLGGGSGTTGKLDAKALLAMSDEEFAEATNGKRWAQIMAG